MQEELEEEIEDQYNDDNEFECYEEENEDEVESMEGH